MWWHAGLASRALGLKFLPGARSAGCETLGTELGLAWDIPDSLRRATRSHVPCNPSSFSPAGKPCIHVRATSQHLFLRAAYLFLQVPNFNSLLSCHLTLQAPHICKGNAAIALFPQAPPELPPELLQLLSNIC